MPPAVDDLVRLDDTRCATRQGRHARAGSPSALEDYAFGQTIRQNRQIFFRAATVSVR